MCGAHFIHVSSACCVLLDSLRLSLLLFAFHLLSHLPFHSPDHLHLPCGGQEPCALLRMRTLAPKPRTILSHIKPYLKYGAVIVNHDDVVPPPIFEVTLETLVSDRDNNATSIFFSHVAGTSLESCEFLIPSVSNNRCVPSIQQFACATYFPNGARGCTPGNASTCRRLCRSGCQEMVMRVSSVCTSAQYPHSKAGLTRSVEMRHLRSTLGVERSLARHHPHSCYARDLFFSSGVMVRGFGVRGPLPQSLVLVAVSMQGGTNDHLIPEWRDYPISCPSPFTFPGP